MTQKSKHIDLKKNESLNFYIIDKNHVFVHCDDAQAKVFGYENATQLIGKSLYDLFPKEVAFKLIANNLLVIDTQKELSFEEEISVNGILRRQTSQKQPFYIDNQVFGVMGISQETVVNTGEAQLGLQSQRGLEKFLGQGVLAIKSLSQRLSGEIAAGVSINPYDYLLKSYDYFEGLVASIPIQVYWMNREGKYLGCSDANAKAQQLSSRYEMIGKTNEYLHTHHNLLDPKQLDSNNLEVMTSGTNRIFKEKDRNANGVVIDYLSSKAPMFDNTGVVVGLIGTSVPLTTATS